MNTHKCEHCENTTKKRLYELDDGWTAFSIGRSKTRYFCPDHTHMVAGAMTEGIQE